MNTFDYFFEHTSNSEKLFLAGKEEITFRALYKSCLNLAVWLQKETGTGRNIIIISPNNLFFIKTYLAVIKSGNICIPLDPSIEKENFEYITNLTNPSIVFMTGAVQKRLPSSGLNFITEEEFSAVEVNQKIDLQFDPTDGEKCAEIIFTSGSTGKPKGVMISHKNLIANTGSIVKYLQLTQDDRMLVVLPFYYCYGLSLFHTHLRAGGSIVLNNSFIFLGTIISNLLEYKCTGFAGVPSHFQILLRKSDTFKNTHFPDLKYVTQAGGKLAPIFIDEFREAHPEVRFVVMYGQTEATARLSWLPPEVYERRRGSMGKGIPGVELWVVHESGERIKSGETGEVIARGDNIMMGYFADEEGTKNAIRNGWLYTGDLGTVDEDGYIYLTARSKEIIKVRGKRISPKEIEAVILALPEVIDCTIEGIEDEIEGEMLKATVVVRKDQKDLVSKELMIQHCSKHLALFKIPQVYEFKDDLTISPTGKKIKKI